MLGHTGSLLKRGAVVGGRVVLLGGLVCGLEGLCRGNEDGNNTAITLDPRTGKLSPIGPVFPNSCGLLDGSSAFDPVARVIYVVLDCLDTGGMQIVALDMEQQTTRTVLSSPSTQGEGVPNRLMYWNNESGGLYGSADTNLVKVSANTTHPIATMPAEFGSHAKAVSAGGVLYAFLAGRERDAGQSISNSYTTPPFFQNGLQAKSGFEMCFGPSTLGAALGAGAKTRLESSKRSFNPIQIIYSFFFFFPGHVLHPILSAAGPQLLAVDLVTSKLFTTPTNASSLDQVVLVDTSL